MRNFAVMSCKIGTVQHAFSDLRVDAQRGSPVTPGSNAAKSLD